MAENETRAAAEAVMVRTGPVRGRLGMLTGMSLLVGFIPLPVLPDRVVRQLRGAVAQEVASRHGLSLTTEARVALAAGPTTDRMRNMLRKGIELLVRRFLKRFGPLAPLSSVASAFEVYALGHLLERYVADQRTAGTMRIQEAEATRVRKLIDLAVLRTFYPSTEPRQLLLNEGVEDLRDEFTRWIDMLLITGATLPSYLERRLESAFDALVDERAEASDD